MAALAHRRSAAVGRRRKQAVACRAREILSRGGAVIVRAGLTAEHRSWPSGPDWQVLGESDCRPSDRQANGQLLPAAGFTQVPNAGHFIALERPEVPASLLNSAV
jgi:pimeloyl-ACP methyl ester carboxylesterase